MLQVWYWWIRNLSYVNYSGIVGNAQFIRCNLIKISANQYILILSGHKKPSFINLNRFYDIFYAPKTCKLSNSWFDGSNQFKLLHGSRQTMLNCESVSIHDKSCNIYVTVFNLYYTSKPMMLIHRSSYVGIVATIWTWANLIWIMESWQDVNEDIMK